MKTRIIFLSVCTLLFAMLPLHHLAASDVNFYNINAIYGTSMRRINAICQDDYGFVWAASRTGVLRVTNGSCRSYQLPYRTADFISVELIFANSLLYAYTSNGQMFLYNRLYDRFELFEDLRLKMNNNYLSLYQMIINPDGTFWLGTSTGLYRYNGGALERVGVDKRHVHALEQHSENRLFFSTEQGIKQVNTKTLETEFVYRRNSTQSQILYTLHYDAGADRLWVGTFYDGLYCLEVKKKEYRKISLPNFLNQPILAISQNYDSTLFIAIDGKGILKLNRQGDKVIDTYHEDINNPSSLRGNGVNDIFCDNDKRVWVSTYTGGLSFFEQEPPIVKHITHKINNQNSLVNDNINRILEDSKGDIWFATDNGLSRWQRKTNTWNTYCQGRENSTSAFFALCEDTEGNIWAGTYSSGIFILDRETGREKNHLYKNDTQSGFSLKFVFDIYTDSEGDIWIGGIQGAIQCYLKREKRFRSYNNQAVNSFCEISKGKILATCSYGLIEIDKAKGDFRVLSEGYIAQDMAIVGDDIWVGTCGDGLLKYNYKTGHTERFSTDSGLLSNYVTSMIFFDNHLLLGTENGFCKFSIEDHSVQTYPSAFSFLNVSYNITARTKLKNGKLIWGTNNGAILFDPNVLGVKHPVGKIFYQDILVSGRSIREMPKLLRDVPVDQQTGLSLNYDQNSVSVELLPIGLSASDCRFSWQLEGVDRQWRVLRSSRA